MKKTFRFGKIDFNGNGRKTNLVSVDVELRLSTNLQMNTDLKPIKEYYVFTASGNILAGDRKDYESAGQNLDTIKEYLPDNELFDKIYKLWKKYHLNDLNAGTEKQQKALKSCKSKDYTDRCNYLEKKELIFDNGYKYGSSWLVKEIPDSVIDEIKELLK